MLWDGLSPAIVLSKKLLEIGRKGSDAVPLPLDMDRARIVRILSVFVSQLESVAAPGEPNYDICKQANMAISYALDALLKGPQTNQENGDLMHAVSADLLGEFDRSEWAGMIDWMGGHTRIDWPTT